MKSIYEMNAKVMEVNGGNCVDVFAFAKDEQYKDVTLAYELCGADEQIYVYAGRVNTDVPGWGTIEDYADREGAVCGRFGEAFRIVFDVADKLK